MNNIQDKVRGCFLGVAIGDSLGKPVESMKAEAIAEKFGAISDYLDCSSHKYFQNDMKGTTTDDWQLTKAIARAIITKGKIDLDEIASEHCKEFTISVRGWGGSTREAVERIANGVHWSKASKTEVENRGLGNGVCMKVTPVGLYIAMTSRPISNETPWKEHIENIRDIAIMTHDTSIAITSGLAHTFATLKCFLSTPKSFDKTEFIQTMIGAADLGRQYRKDTLKDDMATRFNQLNKNMTNEEIINNFGGGTCYVYDSLPFTYAFFLRDPNNIQNLYDCVNAGGDTDSNASMLAALYGALHGQSIFPQNLIDGLKEKDEVLEIADRFYQTFRNK